MSAHSDKYIPEEYWSDVAKQIADREDGNVVAGDDEPYYDYKRREFLSLFRKQTFSGKEVLELGPGPGGNLLELEKLGAAAIAGVDISQTMIDIARQRLKSSTTLYKTDGKRIPLDDNSYDVVYSVTVLQHITDEEMLKSITREMARVSRNEILVFERIESTIKGHDSNLGRPISYYQSLFSEFTLEKHRTLQIGVSRRMSAATRRWLNSNSRKEGEPISAFALRTQQALLPITKILDKVFPTSTDLTLLHFKKK